MRASLALVFAASLALASACGDGGSTVEVTIRADTRLAPGVVSSIRKMQIHVDGAEVYDKTYPITTQLSLGDARWRYFAAASTGELTFSIECLDDNATRVATGTTSTVLRKDGTNTALVLLGPPGSELDGGAGTDDLGTLEMPPPGSDLANVPDLEPAAGLAAWYRFEDTTGLVVLDSSGNGNHGTLVGSGYIRGNGGQIGLCLSFGASGGHVRIPSSPSLATPTAFTVELWLKLTNTIGTQSTVSRGNGGGDNNILQDTASGNMTTSFTNPTSTATATTLASAIAPGKWTHVAAVNDGATIYTYIDGTLVSTSVGGGLGLLTSDLVLGRRANGSFPLVGSLDEVKWWTVARTSAEVCTDAGGTVSSATCLF